MRPISASVQALNSGPAVVARIGPCRPIFSAHCLNGFPCPAAVPTVACTSSCASTSRMRASRSRHVQYHKTKYHRPLVAERSAQPTHEYRRAGNRIRARTAARIFAQHKNCQKPSRLSASRRSTRCAWYRLYSSSGLHLLPGGDRTKRRWAVPVGSLMPKCPDTARFQADSHFARWRLDCLAGHAGLEPANPFGSYPIGIP
jgi:hypothetical protein